MLKKNKIFILDDNEGWLKLFQHTIIPHFNLRNVEFTLLTTSWSELLDHEEVKDASLFIIDFFLKNAPMKSQFPALDYKADITGLELAVTCKTLAPKAKIKIVTCGKFAALDLLNSKPEFRTVCDPKDIITKPVSLEVMKNIINELD